jgi:hypothetical protein
MYYRLGQGCTFLSGHPGVLCGQSFDLSAGDWVNEEFTIYLNREIEFIICRDVPPLYQYALMACYFKIDFNLKSLPTQLLLSTPTLHFIVIESVVQQDP